MISRKASCASTLPSQIAARSIGASSSASSAPSSWSAAKQRFSDEHRREQDRRPQHARRRLLRRAASPAIAKWTITSVVITYCSIAEHDLAPAHLEQQVLPRQHERVARSRDLAPLEADDGVGVAGRERVVVRRGEQRDAAAQPRRARRRAARRRRRRGRSPARRAAAGPARVRSTRASARRCSMPREKPSMRSSPRSAEADLAPSAAPTVGARLPVQPRHQREVLAPRSCPR